MTNPDPPVKAVLFDLDDTLWPIAPVIARAETILYEWLMRHAPGVAQRFTIEHLRDRRRALMPTQPHFQFDLRALRHAGLMEAFVDAKENPALVDAAMEVFSTARNDVVLFDDVASVLQRLSRQVALGSISNGVADLKAIGLADYFQVSIAAHQVGHAKPGAAIFHAACTALRVMPGNAVYVGDDLEIDVEGAQRAGLRAVWLNRSGLAVPEHIRPDATCSTLSVLEDWLNARIYMASTRSDR